MINTFYFTTGKEKLTDNEKVALACKEVSPQEIRYYLRISIRDHTLLSYDTMPDFRENNINLNLITKWKKVSEKAFTHYINYLSNKHQQNYRYATLELTGG
jgi:hypothetical protein